MRHALTLILPCIALLAIVAGAPPVQEARLDRGEQVRAILLDALEQSYQNGGQWPDTVSSPDLLYAKPAGLTDASAVATVVVHEPVDQHPDGVWVGYADGHLEFANNKAELAACENQLAILNSATTPESPGAVSPATGELTLKIVGPDGAPVAGAVVDDQPKETPIISNDAGIATIPAARIFGPQSSSRFANAADAPLYILQKGRGLVALEDIHPADFNSGQSRLIRLRPACHVTGNVTSLGLRRGGVALLHVHTYATRIGEPAYFGPASDIDGPRFQLLLPPGDFAIATDGTMCDYATRYVRIAPGERQLNLQIDIPPYLFAGMFGQYPPELSGIKGWQNSGPLTLKSLRGKVVLLNFWGYWCPPCITEMPSLMMLHDQFSGKGLEILAVHDDSADSIAELDQRLASPRQKFWSGRDLPFPIALDGGGETRIKYSQMKVQGTTTAEYGILQYPTSLLIGRDGILKSRIVIGTPESREQIQKLLDAPGQ